MTKFILFLCTALAFSGCLVNTALAHEAETHYDRINLSVNASSKIENDTVVAVLFAIEEGSDVTTLSDQVNLRIRDALKLVKKNPSINHQTSAYSSNPVYSSNKIKGWRVSQSLRLESKDMALMSHVLGQLQNTLALQSMQFMASAESKNAQDEILIDEALVLFERRAQQVVKKLQRNGYKILDMSISTSGGHSIQPQYEMRAMSIKTMESSPQISAGEQTVLVSINGSIELE